MVRAGTIDFQRLNMLGNGGGMGDDQSVPLYADMLNLFSFRLQMRNSPGVSAHAFASYPRGSQ